MRRWIVTFEPGDRLAELCVYAATVYDADHELRRQFPRSGLAFFRVLV